ncbi:MAG: serine/threonine protein kinase, partial [Lentisphaerae bacterium]|nr:serine/threonine protein kinase [Lentisphaerota bacterium]
MDAPQFPGFEIIATLPHSGMSTVYKARQLALDRLVALKTLPAALASDPADVQQFLTEARITANLKHPNIVQVHDFGQTEQGIYYFVMEFISGYSLGDWIRRTQKLSEEHALLVAQSVAEAMQYAWQEARVVHCDIKPDNVIIDSDGTVKLADLGLAQSMRSAMDRAKTRLEIVYGTPNYISPEQSRGGTALDCRADIYSLGATLYHCLTGQMPFEDAPAATAIDLQITDQIPDALELNPHLSVAVVGLVEKMMAKDRELRQPSWEALLADIRRVLLHQKPDDGAWLPEGASTMQRSVPRETQPRIKVALPPSAPAPDPAPSVPISTTFQNVERRFVLRQQRKRKKKLGWWLAGVGLVGAAVLLLLFGAPLPRLQDSERSLPLLISAHLRERVSGAAEDSPESAAMHQENLRQRFAWVQQWPLTNAFQIREALRQYEQIASDTNATPYAALAAAEIHKLQDLIQQAAAAVMADLEAQTQPLIAQNNFGAAADSYDQYQGAWAAETAASRGAKVRELRGQSNAQQAQLSAAAQQAALHLSL